jgi:aminopeptidase N
VTGRPLTRDEARHRAELLAVSSYDIDLDLTRGDEIFGSRVTIGFASAEEGASTFVELRASRLVSAVLNGEPLEESAYDGTRIALTALQRDNVLVVDAEMPYTTTGDGMHRYVDPADGEVYVGAYVGVVNAQHVFANFDQLDLKATMATRVTAPLGWTVLGNGLATSGDPTTGRWELATTPRLSSCLFVLVAGPLYVVTTEHAGIPFVLSCRRSLAATLDADAAEILEVTTACFDRYAEVFTEPFAFESYGQAFVPELNWGALEQPGAILFRDEMLFTSPPTALDRLERANGIAHEMAHMWFGDLVTMQWWDDLWLSESFAEYMASRTLMDSTRFTGAWTWFAADRKPWGYDADERTSTHPVAPRAEDVQDTESAFENFDGISYAKGASALKQLVAWLGDDVFLAGINDLLTAHAFGNATLVDVLAALDARSEHDVFAWAEAWLRTTGVDPLHVERLGRGTVVSHPGQRPHVVSVGLYDLAAPGSTDLVLRRRDRVLLEPGSTTTPLDLGDGPPPAAILLDEESLSWAKIRYDSQTRAAIAAGLSSIADPLARATVWSALRDQVRDAELAPTAYVEILCHHLPHEADALIIDAVLDFVRVELADRYVAAAERAHVLHEIRGVCRDLLTDPESSTDARLSAARWMVASISADGADILRGWLTSGVPGGPALDDNMRWRIVRRLAVLGATDVAEIDALESGSPDEEAGRHAAYSRAALPEIVAKERAWELAIGGDAASNYAVLATMEGFWQPEHRELLAPFVERFFPAVVEASRRRGPAIAQSVAFRAFPFHDVLPSTEALLLECLAGPGPTVPLRRALADRADDYRRALNVRAAWA